MARKNRPDGPAARTFPFLKLPVEIRTLIYQLVLIVEKPIKITTRFHRAVHQSTTRSGESLGIMTDEAHHKAISGHSAVALTATCRQGYLESISLYYADNTFECVTQGAFSEFLDDIGTTNKHLVSHIHIAARNFGFFHKLTDVKSLSIFGRGFNGKNHLFCCVPRALKRLSQTYKTLETVEVYYDMLLVTGTIMTDSMGWSRSNDPSIDEFLDRLSHRYRDEAGWWCTPWRAFM